MLACETEALSTEAETKVFSVETEAKTKPFSLEAEARPRRLKFQPRRDRAEALLRLETASGPRRQERGHIPGLLTSVHYFTIDLVIYREFTNNSSGRCLLTSGRSAGSLGNTKHCLWKQVFSLRTN